MDINLDMNEDDIIMMKVEKYMVKVKNKVRQAAFNYLKQMKVKHSKMDNLHYFELKMQSFFDILFFVILLVETKFCTFICY